MSELKAGVIVTPHNEGMSFSRDSDHVSVTEGETEFYLKSEADKKISELNVEIKRLMDWNKKETGCHLSIERHSKYKRCLAMSKLCRSEWAAAIFIPEKCMGEKHAERYMRWHKRWLELAEQFKED